MATIIMWVFYMSHALSSYNFLARKVIQKFELVVFKGPGGVFSTRLPEFAEYDKLGYSISRGHMGGIFLPPTTTSAGDADGRFRYVLRTTFACKLQIAPFPQDIFSI